MTEYEILQIQAMYVDTLGSNIMNFISILSGYLLASYYLGAKLNISQFVVLTLTYIVVMTTVIFSVTTTYDQIWETELALQELGRTWESKYLPSTGDALAIKYPVAISQIAALMGSIYFAVVSRVRGGKSAQQA